MDIMEIGGGDGLMGMVMDIGGTMDIMGGVEDIQQLQLLKIITEK